MDTKLSENKLINAAVLEAARKGNEYMSVVSVVNGWTCEGCGVNRNAATEVWRDCTCKAVKEITVPEAQNIFASMSPEGLFYFYDEKENVWIGIDNSHSEAFTEEFETKERCLSWLRGEFEV